LTYVFVADVKTMTDDEHSLLAVDLYDEPGRTFRVPPRWFPDVSANLTIANMDFADYAEHRRVSKSDNGRRDTYRARLPHCGLSVLRCDPDTVPVRIGCEEGQPEPRIMRLVQDRDALGLPLLEDRVELVGSTVDGQANLTGTRDVRRQILELARPQSEVSAWPEAEGDVSRSLERRAHAKEVAVETSCGGSVVHIDDGHDGCSGHGCSFSQVVGTHPPAWPEYAPHRVAIPEKLGV
jgi:hypothetical protein